MPRKPQPPSTNAPRQFRYAGPMRMKNTSEESLMPVRHAVARHPNDIKYVAIYRMKDGTVMVLARAHDKLSVFQWRAILGAGVQEIVPIDDLTDAIQQAKQQEEGFEEFGSMSRRKASAPPRIIKTPAEASQEQVVHVQLRSPSPEPAITVVKEAPISRRKQQAEALAASKHPYAIARAAFVRTNKDIRRQNRRKQARPPPLPVDPALLATSIKSSSPSSPSSSSLKSTNNTLEEIMQRGAMLAHAAYTKYLEDYISKIHLSAPAVGVKRTHEQMIQP